jgi:signal transduction histidine kinase
MDIRDLNDFDGIIVLDSVGKKIFSTSENVLPVDFSSDHQFILRNKFSVLDLSGKTSSDSTLLVYVIPFALSGQTGYIVVKENFQRIKRLLLERTGMGGTGESYLIGEDFRMRSPSRFFPAKLPRSITVKTFAFGSTDTVSNNHIITDYRGKRVVSYHRKLSTPLLGWILISEIDFSEAMRPIIQLRNYVLLIALGLMVIIIVSTVFISNVISRPILYLKDVIISLAQGIIPPQKINVVNRDEIGQIAGAISQLIDGLKRTTDFAQEIGSGNFNTTFTTLGNKDSLGLTLIHMRDQLKSLNERQIRLVREKAGALLEGQENERKRIVQELHDGVGQLLTVAQLRVEMLDNEPALRKEIMGLIHETIGEVRRISYNVMPNAIVDFGLEAALKGLCENSRKYTSLSFDFQYVREVDRTLSFEVTIAVFRIVQEGINNIIKHAKATHVDVYVLDKGDEIYVLLKDDGQGFDEEQVLQKNGFGLRSMRERATLLNGNVEIHSSLGKGTAIEVNIPIENTQ